jgi:hypothetical protein
MPLFDFFKKPNKKEKGSQSPQQPASDNPFASQEQNKKRYEAAMEFLQFFQENTPLLNGRPHAGTVLAIPARLAGTSLFRAIHKEEYSPDVVVLSDEVNEAYPQLLKLFGFFCKQNGIDVMAKPIVTEFPEDDEPLMNLAQVQKTYQDEYNKVMKKHGLDYLEGARTGMVLSSIVFNYHCINNKDIDPYVATGIVARGVIESAKTGPVPFGSGNQEKSSNSDDENTETANLIKTIAESSISGSGNRLFFGEQDAAVQEALDNNGKFVLVHPEVESKLNQGNIDPYVIYVTTLIVEMQSNIDQIDFVGGDVEQLAQQWSSKPEKSAPMHIRQMLWLKENAGQFGYQQSGNSWKRK